MRKKEYGPDRMRCRSSSSSSREQLFYCVSHVSGACLARVSRVDLCDFGLFLRVGGRPICVSFAFLLRLSRSLGACPVVTSWLGFHLLWCRLR